MTSWIVCFRYNDKVTEYKHSSLNSALKHYYLLEKQDLNPSIHEVKNNGF